jgi:hypothetical protein
MLKNILMSILLILVATGVLSLLGIFFWGLDVVCQFALVVKGEVEFMEGIRRGWNLQILWIPAFFLILLSEVPGFWQFFDEQKARVDEKFTKILKSMG